MTELPVRFKTYMRWREARGASRDELELLHELAATLPPTAEPAFDLPALLRELYPSPMTLALRRATQAATNMAAAIGRAGAGHDR